MTALTRRLAQEHHALLRYDDGAFWRISFPQCLVQGRKCVNTDVVQRLVDEGALVWVACQMWSKNEVWRAVEKL